MTDVLPLAIGLGLVVSLLLSELLGVASAGMVVPGYLALYLMSPVHVLSTLCAAFATYLAVRFAGRFLIVFGRRRTALAILIGYLVGAGCDYWVTRAGAFAPAGMDPVVGYIIPGLIAIWMDRQGVVGTLLALAISSSLVRLMLILVFGAELSGLAGLG